MPNWKPIAEAPKSNRRLAGWSPNWSSWRQIQRKDGKWWCLTEKGVASCVPTHFAELSIPQLVVDEKSSKVPPKHLKAVA